LGDFSEKRIDRAYARLLYVKPKEGKMKRKVFGIGLIVVLVGLHFSPAMTLAAEEYPSRTIEYVVGWGAGGGSDTFARIINIPVRRKLGQKIAVVNMPGASSSIAMQYIQQQPADGYTLFGCTSELSINQLQGLTTYTFKDFTPIIRAHVDVGALQTAPGREYKTWKEIVDFAKGTERKIRLAGIGAASIDEIASVIVLDCEEITEKFTYIPFESAGKMHAALLGGHIDVMYEEPGVTIDLIDAGKMIPLIFFTEKRLERFPNVPCAGELGYEIPPMLWRGITVKKGTPQAIVDRLEEVYTKAMEHPMYKAFEESRLLTLFPGYLGSKDFETYLAREYQMYKKVVEKLGMGK
jgi:tripartite-type tricarboxylate transporter receptor subunit TctC